jgi:hypothetical protein
MPGQRNLDIHSRILYNILLSSEGGFADGRALFFHHLYNSLFQFHTMAPDVIYNAGDLRLKVGGKRYPKEQLEFVVCSKSLSQASRRFKKLLRDKLQPSTKSTTTTQNVVVKLPEDDPVGLQVLLDIIHGEYVPSTSTSTITLVLLYRILAVSEKYNMSHLIRPWVNTWFQPHADLVQKPANNFLLMVAWMVGAIDVFRGVVKIIYQKCEVNYEGQLLDIEKNPVVDIVEPQGIFGKAIY